MNHKGTMLLETERLILRKFKCSDIETMYHNWANDDEVTKFLTWPTHENSQVTAVILESWIAEYNEMDTYKWCIEFKETGEAIGSISIVSINQNVNSLEIGYCIGQKYWNHGLTSEAVRRVVDYLFSHIEANRIEAHVDPRNNSSAAVLVKAGFIETGLRRQVAINNMGICDVVTYEILQEDYRK